MSYSSASPPRDFGHILAIASTCFDAMKSVEGMEAGVPFVRCFVETHLCDSS